MCSIYSFLVTVLVVEAVTAIVVVILTLFTTFALCRLVDFEFWSLKSTRTLALSRSVAFNSGMSQ